ncbi:MAG TPA: hypothetical protein VEG34_13005, partial [Thermoanaerobaculia bacterium]|nr:hypothetical protein [Thermoanaerobaculia bacterium]
MSADFLLPTGINGATGAYRLRPSFQQIAYAARGRRVDERKVNDLAEFRRQFEANGDRGLRDGHDPCILAEAGWGVIFAAADPLASEIKKKLQPLLDRRKDEAGSDEPDFYREFIGSEGYRPGESKHDFLARHRVGPGIVNPYFMPYYLLIVGDPATIPYEFQYELDIEYAVGRLFFKDLEEYGDYAASVEAHERAAARRGGKMVLFAPAHQDDYATSQTGPGLVSPLQDFLNPRAPGWQIESVTGDQADKPRLARLLGGGETPDLLFTV